MAGRDPVDPAPPAPMGVSVGAPPGERIDGAEQSQRIAAVLAHWFAEHGRDLPWRQVRDPWAILVSELMLQQTQVSRVVERWPDFLGRFPDPATMAASPRGEVITAWAGLGYNRRAVFLHRAAISMVEIHDGRVPESLADLQALPGVGPYTARAVRVFAYEASDAVVDTNVARILARLDHRRFTPAGVQRRADELCPNGAPWIHNQALLDVGALLCRPRAPECSSCPLRRSCRWFLAGRPEPDPARTSAGVSGRQSRFAGSDREGRGRLLRALQARPLSRAELAEVMGWPDDPMRARRVAETLVVDGLATLDDHGRWCLPA